MTSNLKASKTRVKSPHPIVVEMKLCGSALSTKETFCLTFALQQFSAPGLSVTELQSPPTRDIDSNNLGQKVPPSIPPRPAPEISRSPSDVGYVTRDNASSAEDDSSTGKPANSRLTDSDSISTTGSITSASTEGDETSAPPIPPKMIPRSSSVHHQVSPAQGVGSGPTTPVSLKSPPGGSPKKAVPSTPTSVSGSLPSLTSSTGGKSPPPIPKRNFSSMQGGGAPSSQGTTPSASLHSSQDSMNENASSA